MFFYLTQIRDKQLRFARKRKELRRQKQMEQEKEQNIEMDKIDIDLQNEEDKKLEKQQYDEYYSRFRDKLFRIEKFVVYRNMLLNETWKKERELGIHFDYVMVVDMDIFNIDIRTFVNELYFLPDDLNGGLCVDGIDWLGYTRDTFATVKANGGWLHYGHDPEANDTEYVYQNSYALKQRTKIPNENNRYHKVKSCFGGIIAYNNIKNQLYDSDCKYTLTRDIFWTTYNNSLNEYFDEEEEKLRKKPFIYNHSYWVNHRHHNKYTEQSKYELQLFRQQYIEILQIENIRLKEAREYYPKDGDICEHIPYHYCLNDYGLKFAISSRAKLYYDELYPPQEAHFRSNWENYLQNRPKFTK